MTELLLCALSAMQASRTLNLGDQIPLPGNGTNLNKISRLVLTGFHLLIATLKSFNILNKYKNPSSRFFNNPCCKTFLADVQLKNYYMFLFIPLIRNFIY